MGTPVLYLFRSSELFVTQYNTLPIDYPDIGEESLLDSMDIDIAGVPSRILLFKDEASRAAVVSASVCGPPASSDSCGGESSGKWIRLRSIFASDDPLLASLASPAARALGLINWHNSCRFCARCGTAVIDKPGEIARVCPACSAIYYPRISPAIIVLVHKGDTVLLARHAARNQEVYSCIAGFLEHGETLEECVAREVFEETGISVTDICYAGSQSWPYPDQHMIAFHARWASGEVTVDPKEILEARWFPRDAMPATPMPGTVAWRLIFGDWGDDFR